MAKEVKVGKQFNRDKTLGQRAADALTKWAGSWTFIIIFLMIVLIWMAINILLYYSPEKQPFDKYPFILLNLALSLLAAIQAPIILMSQNRQSQKDRLRTEYDYAIDRKTSRDIQEIKKQLNKIEKKIN